AAQDVDVSLTQSDFKMLGQNVCESGYHYTFTNSQDRPIQIKLKEEIPYDFRMLRESIPNESKIKNQLVWIISLEPKETKHIRFRLRVSKQG
ncbi:MAG: hypothetical protein HOI80_05840, partial [Alphaproteobacteria bacterium]|nr:hypothetical protein [Alphaproteobacteria bacterium]